MSLPYPSGRGAPKGDDAAAKKKAELLARMKAAAEARKSKD